MKYTALFKGINVGGKNVVKMDALKQLFLDLGMQKVKTYIQSGNVVFETPIEEASLRKIIQTGFAERFGFESDVMLRNIHEIEAVLEEQPFSKEEITAAETANPEVEHLYIHFLEQPPEQTQMDLICKDYAGPDIIRLGRREVYLLCHQSIRTSKPAIRAAKVLPSATVRNWKTVSALYDMLKAL